jgi:hypothetical protein
VTVHDVDVDEISGSTLDSLDFCGEAAKVSRQDGGGDSDVLHGRGL